MERLCESEEGESEGSSESENTQEILEGLPDPEKTEEMALAVYAKAKKQAGELLEACALRLEQHFSSIGKCLRITLRKTVERNWDVMYSIWPKNRYKPAKPKMTAGIEIVVADTPELIPWVWRLGGEEADKMLGHVLGNRVKARSGELDWPAGCVGLDRIPILPDGLAGFDVEREPLVEKVEQAFRGFTPQDLEALWPR
jgi:hypothetical protein